MKTKRTHIFSFLLINVLLSLSVTGQNTFFRDQNTPNSVQRSMIVEGMNNSSIMIYNEDDNYINESRSRIQKLNSNGDIELYRDIVGINGGRLNHICSHTKNDQYIVAGALDSLHNDDMISSSFIEIIDESLTALYKINIDTVTNLDSHFRSIIPFNDSIVFLLQQHHNVINRKWWIKIYKCNIITGELNWFQTSEESTCIPFDMILNNDTSLSVFYFGESQKKSKGSFNWILNLDINLNFQSIVAQPFNTHLYSFAKCFTDSTYILSSMSHYEYIPFHTIKALEVYEMSLMHDSIKSVMFYPDYPEDTVLYPFFNNNLAISDNSIAIGGVFNIDIYGYPTQYSPCWIQLTFFDHDLKMLKQIYYGDGVKAYYGMDIISTSDGGFALCGSVSDPQNTTYPQPDLFVLKVNSEGLITTGNNEIESPQMTEVIIWPNPGSEKINLKSAVQLKNAVFELYNISGNLCHTENLSPGTTQTIHAEHLSKGVYTYRITDGNKLVKSGKWIKE